MDNEGLLEWAEYEVRRAWAVLKRAESHRDKIRKVVKEDKDKEACDIDTLTLKVCAFIKQETARIRKKNEFKMVYGMSEEEARKAFLRRCGVSEDEEARKAFLRRCGVSEDELKH